MAETRYIRDGKGEIEAKMTVWDRGPIRWSEGLHDVTVEGRDGTKVDTVIHEGPVQRQNKEGIDALHAAQNEKEFRGE